MAYKPLLFNTEMVQAIMEGRKTQTRRIIKLPPGLGGRPVGESGNPDNPLGFMYPCGIKRPPCNKGDILWVRETWFDMTDNNGDVLYRYAADLLPPDNPADWRWKPSIHMPKEAARIFLRVKDVRVEHLGDMRLHDCLNEGVRLSAAVENDLVRAPIRAREWFSQVWDSTIKPADLDKYGWNANPWVWVIEFERCEKPEGWCAP